MDEDLDLVGGVIVNVPDLDLTLGIGGEDGLDERRRGHSERQLGNGEEVFGALLDLRADLHFAAALSVVIVGKIGGTAGWEIRKDAEGLFLEMIDRGAAEVVEIMREDLGGKTDRDAIGPSRRATGNLAGKCDRLLVAAIVAELPGGGLRVEQDVLGKRGQAGLDVARRAASSPVRRLPYYPGAR